jgi:hypothetical protein
MSTKTEEVQALDETSNRIWNAAYDIVSAMKDGDRKQIKDLATDVGAAVGMEPKKVLGFVNHFAHETKIAYVTRGKKGGLIRGPRPVKVVKPKKAKKSDTVSTDQTQ